MPEKCRICSHAKRELIEAAMSEATAAELKIAKQFGVTESSLNRHWQTHVMGKVARMPDTRLWRRMLFNVARNNDFDTFDRFLGEPKKL